MPHEIHKNCDDIRHTSSLNVDQGYTDSQEFLKIIDSVELKEFGP